MNVSQLTASENKQLEIIKLYTEYLYQRSLTIYQRNVTEIFIYDHLG